MRPVERGKSPRDSDFEDYRDAFPELQSRIGAYCSYCERPFKAQLHVEHIQPKDENRYPELTGRWDNYLLGCVNCNATKGDRDVRLDDVALPDRDNTFAAYTYSPDGAISLRGTFTLEQRQMAHATLTLTGLNKTVRCAYDENGRLVAMDRTSQRMEAWAIAQESLNDLAACPTGAMRRQIVRTARAHGFFSVWMAVFQNDGNMRRMFIDSFPGTAQDCFDPDTTAEITPRPSNGLAGAGKL